MIMFPIVDSQTLNSCKVNLRGNRGLAPELVSKLRAMEKKAQCRQCQVAYRMRAHKLTFLWMDLAFNLPQLIVTMHSSCWRGMYFKSNATRMAICLKITSKRL